MAAAVELKVGCEGASVGLAGVGDDELAVRARAGDERAFEALYRRWSGRVLRFAQRRLGERAEAEDVVQEVFLALHRGLGSYEGRSRFGTWLLGIAHHLTCRAQRRRSRRSLVPLDGLRSELPALRTPSSAEARFDARRALERCADAMAEAATPTQREVFRLVVTEGRTAEAAARELRRPAGTVRAQLLRMRRSLLARAPGLAETLS